MNAILQCFIHTPLIKSYFLSGLFKNHMAKVQKPKNNGALCGIIANFSYEYEKLNDLTNSLWEIKNTISKCIPNFQGYNQHDAQEFLGMMLNKLTEELTVVGVIDEFPTTGKSVEDDVKSTTKTTIEKSISIMGDLFCGELCSTVICPNCNNESEKKEPFYYLSVPLPLKVVSYFYIRKHI